MASFALQLPQITEATLDSAAERRRILGYLYQLNEQLRYTLAHLDDENIAPGGISLPSLSGEVSRLISSKASGDELRTAMEQTASAISLLASRETTDALGERVGEAEGALTVQADQIAGKVSQTEFNALGERVGEAEGALTVQVDQIAAKVSQAEFNALGERVGAAESALTVQADQIAGKVSQTEFNALGERVGEAESALTVQADQIELKVSKTEFQTGIGGANLLRLDRLTATGQASIVTPVRTYYSAAAKGMMFAPLTGSNSQARFSDVTLKRGQKYTLSFWAWWYLDAGTTSTSMLFHWNLYRGDYDLYSSVLMSQGLCTPNAFDVPRATPAKFAFTFELPSTVDGDYTDWMLRFVSRANSVNIYVRDVKLEQGLCATAWNDSPEATEQRMTAAESTITQQAHQIQTKVAQTTYNAGIAEVQSAASAAQTAADAAQSAAGALGTRMTQAESTITQQAHQIQTKVAQTTYESGISGVIQAANTAQSAASAAQATADAAQSAAGALGTRMTQAESAITQQATAIDLRVTETDVTDLLSAADDKTIRTSSVTIDGDGVEIESTGTIGLKSGGAMRLDAGSDMAVAVDGDAKLTIDDQGLSADMVRAGSVSAPNLILRQAGGAIPWSGSLQSTLDSMGKYLDGACTITAQGNAGGLTGDTGSVTIKDFMGGNLTINMAGVTLAYPLRITNCTSIVYVQGTSASPGIIAPQMAGAYAVYLLGSKARLDNMRITGAPRTSASGGSQYGVYALFGSVIGLYTCTIERTSVYAIHALYGSHVMVYACRGGLSNGAYDTVANIGYMAMMNHNATMSLNGTMPSSANGVFSERGAVYGTATATDSAGVTPVVTTQTVTYTASDYGRMTLPKGAGSIGSEEWHDQYMPRQGSASNSDYYGCWILNDAYSIAFTLSGKTITGITLKLERSASYGNYGYQQVQLWAHPWYELPTYGSSASPIQNYTLVGNIASGFLPTSVRTLNLQQELTAAQYDALKTGLQDGSIRGFGLRGGYADGARPYLQMSGLCELTVTYTG